jgi:hypothetical protein
MKIVMGLLEVLATDFVHAETTQMKGEIRKVAYNYVYHEYKDGRGRLQFIRYFEEAIQRRRQ